MSEAPVRSSSRTAAILLTLGALLTIGLVALVLVDTMIARSIATREAQRSLATTANLVAAHARRTLADVSAVVRAEPFPGFDLDEGRAWLGRVKAETRSMPQVAALELGEWGQFYVPGTAEHFVVIPPPRSRPLQWLGMPSRVASGQLLVPFIHKLDTRVDHAHEMPPDAPVLIASIDLGAFHAFYRSIGNLSDTTTDLLLEDGTVLATDDLQIQPHVGTLREPNLGRWIRSGEDLSTGGVLDDEVGAAVRIPEFGLVVVTRRKLSAALEPWGDQALGVAIPAAVLAGFSLLLLYLTRRQLLRLEKDTLERRRLEFEKDELRRSLQHAGRIDSLGRLSTGIAHDFSNVLSAILGYGELARDHSAPDSPAHRHAERIVVAAQRGKALVERLLAFVRAERGPAGTTAVDPLIHETLDLLGASLKPGRRLERACAAEHVMVKAAPTELHQILMNLVTNALQALDADGVVTVRTRVEDITTPYQARTGILGPGTFLRLDVSDTGHGIAPEAVGRIFEPFFTTKPAGAGTGLGLSLVQQLVDELGGAIDVVTRVNSGTTFTVFLPCELRGGTPQPAGETVIRGQGETILLVDDEVALVELGEELLAALGYEPVGFSSSQAAWEAFQRTPHRFDALLTDETMPEHSGTELARLVHSLRADLPIVIMSGYVAPERAEQMQLLGIRHVMRKPLAASELSRTLARALQKRAAAVSE